MTDDDILEFMPETSRTTRFWNLLRDEADDDVLEFAPETEPDDGILEFAPETGTG